MTLDRVPRLVANCLLSLRELQSSAGPHLRDLRARIQKVCAEFIFHFAVSKRYDFVSRQVTRAGGEPYKRRSREKKDNYGDCYKSFMESTYNPFLAALITEIEIRFPRMTKRHSYHVFFENYFIILACSTSPPLFVLASPILSNFGTLFTPKSLLHSKDHESILQGISDYVCTPQHVAVSWKSTPTFKEVCENVLF